MADIELCFKNYALDIIHNKLSLHTTYYALYNMHHALFVHHYVNRIKYFDVSKICVPYIALRVTVQIDNHQV